MSTLAAAIFVVAKGLPAPYVPPDRAEVAASERRLFLDKFARGLASATEEATCTGSWASLECKRLWPGEPAELASFGIMKAWFESKIDEEIQAGRCPVWGPAPTQITCDGQLFRSGYAPPALVGVERRTKWGLVVFTSSTVYQVKVATNDRVREIVGSGEMNVYEASREFARIASSARSFCRSSASWVTCTINSYAGTPHLKQAPARAALYYKVLPKVRAEMRNVVASS